MSTTITVRTDESLREKLEERAAAAGTTVSAFIREVLENAVAERPVGRRAGHLTAKLELPATQADPWRKAIRERNWRS